MGNSESAKRDLDLARCEVQNVELMVLFAKRRYASADIDLEDGHGKKQRTASPMGRGHALVAHESNGNEMKDSDLPLVEASDVTSLYIISAGEITGFPIEEIEDSMLVVDKKNEIKAEKQSDVALHGCGQDFINGGYRKVGSHEGIPIYSKTGTWNGEVGAFVIYGKVSTSLSVGLWRLDFFSQGKKSKIYKFYRAASFGGSCACPPNNSWMPSGYGVYPPPFLQFN